MEESGQTTAAAMPEIIGSYSPDPSGAQVRVRVTVEGTSLVLRTLSERLVAQWSLNKLENRGIPVWGQTWTIGDRRLRGPALDLENDADYAVVATAAPTLRGVRTRFWAMLGFAGIESSQQTGLIFLLAAAAFGCAYWLWTVLPLRECVATHQNVILFLNCTLIEHFIR